ncbi:MAG: hypothetical protein MUF30_07660, partial [Burkholderiales bacterium]|nr:hypothetical protein [Burkholderiales bacterium]
MRSTRHPHLFALSQRSVRLTGLLAGLTTAVLASAPAGAVVVTPGGSYTQSVQATTAFQITDNHGATSSAGVPQGVIRDAAGTRAVEAPAIDTGRLRGSVPDIGVAAQVDHHATARFQAVPDRRVEAKAAALASADTGRLQASAQTRV